jgi:hypothetical protein
MKQRNLILSAIFVALCANGAYATAPAAEVLSGSNEKAQLDEVQILLERLSQAKALEVDEDGNVRVKPSILEKLKRDGRMETQMASFGSICT